MRLSKSLLLCDLLFIHVFNFNIAQKIAGEGALPSKILSKACSFSLKYTPFDSYNTCKCYLRKV